MRCHAHTQPAHNALDTPFTTKKKTTQTQVLKRAFPGVLLVPDICGLDRLPKVGVSQSEFLSVWMMMLMVAMIGVCDGWHWLCWAAGGAHTRGSLGHTRVHTSRQSVSWMWAAGCWLLAAGCWCWLLLLLLLLLQETEMVAAGFPCIDISRAGLRQGLEGAVRCDRVC
jgi:hypothetical protein